jgi:2'-5' RNA ligase
VARWFASLTMTNQVVLTTVEICMRCFVAIEIEEGIQQSLGDLQKQLTRKADMHRGDVKWVHPDAMHLTLKFIGEATDKQIVEICNIVKGVAQKHEAFDMAVKQVGHFGGEGARVLWVGAGLDCEPLLKLQRDLEEALAQVGWPPEGRKFSGHLTLCRIRNVKAGLKLAKLAEEFQESDLGVTRCDSVCVFESQLTPEGPVYTPLGRFKLS